MKAVFYPAWKPFDLASITEGTGISVKLPVSIEAVVNLSADERSMGISQDDAANLTSVERDGGAVSYTIVDGVLTVPDSNRASVIVLRRAAVCSFSVFAGSLPPGILLINDYFRGVVGNIPSKAAVTYRFGLRCHYGDSFADIIKSWSANPADETLQWNYTTLPDPVTNENGKYYSYGDFKRGQKISFDIDIFNPDATPLPILQRPPAAIQATSEVFLSLPLGISITSNPCRLTGFIPAEAIPGDYYVELWVDEPFPLPPIVIHLKVLRNSFDTFTAINRLTWQTDEKLGTVQEGQPAILSISASNSSGDGVTYSLAAGSRTLPTGIYLTPTGELRGIYPHVNADTEFEFTAKVVSGRFVNTRIFHLTIEKHFQTGKTASLSLPISGDVKQHLVANASHLTNRFRLGDKSLPIGSEISIIQGLRADRITELPTFSPTDVLLGKYRSEPVVHDGKTVCDVIYREVIDTREHSGGFASNTPDIIKERALYPENPSIEIREPSLNNIRRDSVFHCGIDTKSNRLSDAILPVWQETYSPILIVGYVAAGEGAKQAGVLPYGEVPIGSKLSFDRILIRQGINSYFFYLGSSGKVATLVAGEPLPPVDLRLDGVPVGQSSGRYTEPSFSWIAQEIDVSFSIEIYNGLSLLRAEEVNGNSFRYTSILQAVDSGPSYITFIIKAKRGDSVSKSVTAGALIRAGWGNAWGLRYGGSA